MPRALARTIVTASMTAALFACGSDSVTGPPVAGTVIATTELKFTPQSITLTRSGGSAALTFTFQSTNHKVVWDTQPSGAAVEEVPSTHDASVLRQLTVAGTYTYHCPFHDGMTGTVIIE
jgi:plastocyanin